MAKRISDVLMAGIGMALAVPILGILIFWVKQVSPGPAIYWSRRVGKNSREFLMPKLRTMKIGTPQLATHLLTDPEIYLVPGAKWIRRFSLDELPQLWSVFIGDMSFVGPRPALFNQQDLISLRKEMGVDSLLPGITGWAQINGRDSNTVAEKARLDRYYFENHCFLLDLKILLRTVYKTLRASNIAH